MVAPVVIPYAAEIDAAMHASKLAAEALSLSRLSAINARKLKTARMKVNALAKYVLTRETAVHSVDAAVTSILIVKNLLTHIADPDRKELAAISLALRRSLRTLLAREKECARALACPAGIRMKLPPAARTMVVKKVLKDQYLDVIDMKKLVKAKYPQIGGIENLSNSNIYRVLDMNHITEKKTHTRDRKTDSKKLGDFWFNMRNVPLDEIVSYDECHVHNKMTRARGWSKAGTKAFSNPKHIRKSERYTLMLAVSQKKVVAWQLVDNSANKEKLCHFLDQRLLPAMQTEGLHEVLLDNASIHRAKDVKKLWEEDSQMRPFIFNPPYNPDSNPVEMVFSIIKRQLRKLQPESKEGMEQAIADVIQSQATEEKLTPIFRHALRR